MNEEQPFADPLSGLVQGRDYASELSGLLGHVGRFMQGGLTGLSGQEQPPWSQTLGTLAHAATDIPGAGGGIGAVLGPARGMMGRRVSHDILDKVGPEGTKVGVLDLAKNPENDLHVRWVHGNPDDPSWGSPNSLGLRETRELLNSIRAAYPEAETLSGFRVSGARGAINKPADAVLRLRPKGSGEPWDPQPTAHSGPEDFSGARRVGREMGERLFTPERQTRSGPVNYDRLRRELDEDRRAAAGAPGAADDIPEGRGWYWSEANGGQWLQDPPRAANPGWPPEGTVRGDALRRAFPAPEPRTDYHAIRRQAAEELRRLGAWREGEQLSGDQARRMGSWADDPNVGHD